VGYDDFYKHLTFEILGDLTSLHGKCLPMLPNFKKLALLADPFLGSRLTASP
jgi:hypothetical protein